MPKYRFHFDTTESPTQFNIKKHLLNAGFKTTKKVSKADFNDKNLTLNEQYTEMLEHKDKLAALTEKHCPEVMPLTFVINDNNYKTIINSIESQPKLKDIIWVLKPALLNNAEGIKLFNNLDDIKSHFQGSQRFSGQHVLQQYIKNPHLLNGHKYTFRMFVIITNFSGVYLYKTGYFNVGRTAYHSNDLTQLEAHLTNEHLYEDHSPNVWQIPTSRCPNFEMIYQQMQQIIDKVIAGLKKEASALFSDHTIAKAFSFFGFDFILDNQLKLWLLEVNHGPCFPIDDHHPLQQHLYDEFWQTIVNSIITPLIKKESIQANDKLEKINV